MISSLTHTMCITMPSNRCPLHIGTYVGRCAELTIQVDANFAMKEALEKYYKQNPFDIIKCEDRYGLVPEWSSASNSLYAFRSGQQSPSKEHDTTKSSRTSQFTDARQAVLLTTSSLH